MGSAADALNMFRSFIGIAEAPPHSNLTPIGDEYGWNGVAWCDETVSVVLRRIGLAPGPIDSSHFASCWFHQQAYRNGECGAWLGKPDVSELQPGDQVFFGSSGSDHTGMVETVHADANAVTTLEGNIGDAVRREYRPLSGGSMRVYGFGRPNYDGSVAPDVPPPSATVGRAVLRKGNRGAAVAEWQKLLIAVGLDIGPSGADGDFGAATDAATRSFQRTLHVADDGEVGPETWAGCDRLFAFLAAQGAPAADPGAPEFPGTVKLGSRGEAVRAVQQRLIDRGWNVPGGADGQFGRATDQVVRKFQAEKGLTVDGVSGPATWVALWTSPVT